MLKPYSKHRKSESRIRDVDIIWPEMVFHNRNCVFMNDDNKSNNDNNNDNDNENIHIGESGSKIGDAVTTARVKARINFSNVGSLLSGNITELSVHA